MHPRPNEQSHPVPIECGVRRRSTTDAYGKSFGMLALCDIVLRTFAKFRRTVFVTF